TGRVLGVDAATADQVIQFRSDLSGNSLESMLGELEADRPEVPMVELPGEPLRLALDIDVELDSLPGDAPAEANQPIAPFVSVVIQDARGMLYRLSGGSLESDAGVQQLVIDLGFDLGESEARPEYPINLVAIEARILIPIQVPRTGRFELVTLQSSASVEGDDWLPVQIASDPARWEFQTSLVTGLQDAPSIEGAAVDGDGSVAFAFTTGSTENANRILPLVYSVQPAADGEPDAQTPIAAIVSDSFLAATEGRVGDQLQVDIAGSRRPLRIVGAVKAFPTVEPDSGPLILVDFPTYSALQFQTSGRIDAADEWWLATDNDETESIAATLGAAPYSSWRINDRFSQAELLRTDPVALGIIGALSLGFVSAALFAVIGFVVSAAVSAHERLTEFSLLRALGLSPRQLSGWLSLENGLLVLISLIGGTALGLLMAWMVLPFVTLTQDASTVVPGIIVAIPWGSILLLEGITIGALALVVLALAFLLRRVGLGTVLRLGEE
ncbi:MAG TPA: ABC transporter permease, partial [Thermomicrobiales bacterium]|nr:ABC transporter permease [Thermomicrobiales bacterium]